MSVNHNWLGRSAANRRSIRSADVDTPSRFGRRRRMRGSPNRPRSRMIDPTSLRLTIISCSSSAARISRCRTPPETADGFCRWCLPPPGVATPGSITRCAGSTASQVLRFRPTIQHADRAECPARSGLRRSRPSFWAGHHPPLHIPNDQLSQSQNRGSFSEDQINMDRSVTKVTRAV
jgi:hypothetical protein